MLSCNSRPRQVLVINVGDELLDGILEVRMQGLSPWFSMWDDIEQLRSVAKTLLRAWQLQASFTEDYAAQLMHLTPPPFASTSRAAE